MPVSPKDMQYWSEADQRTYDRLVHTIDEYLKCSDAPDPGEKICVDVAWRTVNNRVRESLERAYLDVGWAAVRFEATESDKPQLYQEITSIVLTAP